MKKITFKTAALTAGILTLGLTACKKEELIPNGTGKKKPGIEKPTEKSYLHSEGIMSNDGYSGTTDVITGYYGISGGFMGQQPTGLYPTSSNTGTGTVIGCGATTNYYIYAYQNSSGTQYLEGNLGTTPIMDGYSGNTFTRAIEEIEIHPQTLQVYALVSYGNSKRIYVIDPSTGIALPITVGGSSPVIFNNPIGNGYQGGSITFVPDGFGNYDFVFSHESTIYSSSGVASWHYTLIGTNLTSIPGDNHAYTGIPGTFGTGINTTYGNGKLYFARHGSSNAVYSLTLMPSFNTVTSEGFSVTNNNDFGYWKN